MNSNIHLRHIGILNFALLIMCSFGLYLFYWFYKNWAMIRDELGLNIQPVIRSVFYMIFLPGLLKRINKLGVQNDGKPFSWLTISVLVILLHLGFNFIETGNELLDVWAVVIFLSVNFLLFMPVQKSINYQFSLISENEPAGLYLIEKVIIGVGSLFYFLLLMDTIYSLLGN